MTSRSSLDTPAAAISLVLGLLVVAVSLPFAIQALPEAASSYDIAWRERAAASQDLTVPSQTGTYRASVTVSGLASSLTVDPSVACNDNFQPPLQSPATLAFRVTKTVGGTTSTSPDWAGTYTCDTDDAKRTIQLGTHPDVASATASDRATAMGAAWAGVVNQTATYTLEVTPSRPPDTVPIGAAAPTSLAATVRLTVQEWEAVPTPHTPEAVK